MPRPWHKACLSAATKKSWFAACLLWQQERRWLALGYGEAVKALACALSLLGFAFAVIGFYANNLFDLRSGVHFDALLLGAVNIVFMLFLSAPYLNTWRHRLAVALLIGNGQKNYY